MPRAWQRAYADALLIQPVVLSRGVWPGSCLWCINQNQAELFWRARFFAASGGSLGAVRWASLSIVSNLSSLPNFSSAVAGAQRRRSVSHPHYASGAPAAGSGLVQQPISLATRTTPAIYNPPTSQIHFASAHRQAGHPLSSTIFHRPFPSRLHTELKVPMRFP